MAEMRRPAVVTGLHATKELLCPKPQRVVAVLSYQDPFNRRSRTWWSFNRKPSAGVEGDVSYEIMEILLKKSTAMSEELTKYGSPPLRASNPLVNDVQFAKQRRAPPLPLAVVRPKPTKPLGRTSVSAAPSPAIRIEGFDCHSIVIPA